MRNLIVLFFIYSLFTIMCLLSLNTHLSAQKSFEGYLEQTSIRKSNLPMQPPKVTENEKIFYKPGKFKSMNLTTGKDMIFRFDKELSWTIDHQDKSYTEMTFAQMQEGMNRMRSAMKDQMKDMSPEDRKAMEKMMGKSIGKIFTGDETGVEMTVKRTGTKKTILGYSCELIYLIMNDEPMMEMWVTDKLGMGNDFLKVYEKMGFLKGKLSEEAKKINGIPLANKMTIDMGMGKMESETEATKVVKTSVSEDEFEVPKGYKKKEMRMPFNK